MNGVDLTRTLEPQVVAAAQGDREAFARLVDATGSLVCSIALAILRDLEMSRDVAQDVFLAAWQNLRKLRSPASFLPWLRQMTRNRAHHALRSKARLRKVVSEQESDELLAVAVDARQGVAEGLLAAEERLLLVEAIGELPDEAREVVTLYYREGRSVSQVAGLLGKLGALLSGAALGAAGGIAGVVFGLRPLVARARDDAERRALKVFAAAAVCVTLGAAAGFELSAGSPPGMILTFSLFYVTLISLYTLWLPRIIKRRLATELLEDPERAALRHRRDRWLSVLGAVLGLLFGGGGLIWGILHRGHP